MQNQLKSELLEIIKKGDDRLIRMMIAMGEEYNSATESSAESSQLYRLVYTSARLPKCDDKCIDQILEASRSNNSKLGITGILIYTEDRFLQVLEGEQDKVNQLYKKIAGDDRHGGSIMRFCEPVSTRYFHDWDMAAKKMNTSDIQYNTSISDNKKRLYNSMLNGDIHSYKDEGMRVLKTFLLYS